MKLTRTELMLVLNALYEAGIRTVSVSHPSNAIGELIEFELGPPKNSELRFTLDRDAYATARSEVDRRHGPPAVTDLPTANDYVNCAVAGGLTELANRAEIESFLDRYGSPDLNAGHRPVFAGFDTNLLPWRIADVLDLRQSGYWGSEPVVNGFALATGVRDELDWDHKHSQADVRKLTAAFGEPFDRLFNQPAGPNRQGRLGEIHYRQLRDHQYAEEIDCERGDDTIIAGYDQYQQASRKDVLLFSNDRNFVDRARGTQILAQHIDFPRTLPRRVSASWDTIIDSLYMLTVCFGVLELPKTTLYGVWAGKEGRDWHNERIDIDCRSQKLNAVIERGKHITATHRN